MFKKKKEKCYKNLLIILQFVNILSLPVIQFLNCSNSDPWPTWTVILEPQERLKVQHRNTKSKRPFFLDDIIPKFVLLLCKHPNIVYIYNLKT